MSAAPLVTLTVKAYRQERLVRGAIASAFAQEHDGPLEILLSDDASPDGTFAVMQEMAAAYRGPHRVRLNRNPTNLGIVGHANRIAELASGRLLMECAGDDEAEPDRVARLTAAWVAGGGRVLAVHSAVRRIDPEGRLAVDPEGRPLDLWRPDPAIRIDPRPIDVIRTRMNAMGATAAWDRRLFEVFGPIPADCAVEDATLFFRAALLGGVAYLDAPLVRYRTEGLSAPRLVSPAHDHLHGDFLRRRRWAMANMRAFLADMERVPPPDAEACRAACRRFLAHAGFTLEAAGRGPLGRLALVPGGLGRSLRARDGFYAREAVRYALGPLYRAWFDWRWGRAAAGRGAEG